MEIITGTGMGTGILREVNSFGGNKNLPEIVEMLAVANGQAGREMVAETINSARDATEILIKTINK